jgi:L-ascorbate metabolism protein UlaG (beta-lactamase superfamily)
MELIPAFQKGYKLLADIKNQSIITAGFSVWWLGQSGFLLQFRGQHLLFDPYLSNSLTEKYKATDKPHTRMSELVIDPKHLDMIDVVTSSHNHTDHLDAETLNSIFEANPTIKFVAPEANREFASVRCGISPESIIGMTTGTKVKLGLFEIIGLPAAHNDLKIDESGRHQFMSFIVNFGDYAVYHSGDTLWFDGLEELLKPYAVDVAFLPINGNKPERRVAGNLNPDEAANLGKQIGAGVVIPHHYDMFTFNTENPDKFVEAAKAYETPFKVLRSGERLTID